MTTQIRESATESQHAVAQSEKPPAVVTRTVSKAIINFWLDAALLTAVLFVAWVSVMLHIVFPVATSADGWTLWGLSFDQWRNIQSAGLGVGALLALEHLVLHWTWVCGMIATRLFGARKGPDEAVQAMYGIGSFITILVVMAGTMIVAMICVKRPT